MNVGFIYIYHFTKYCPYWVSQKAIKSQYVYSAILYDFLILSILVREYKTQTRLRHCMSKFDITKSGNASDIAVVQLC